MPMLIEATRLLEEGVASKEEIDLLVKKGIGFPIGPFELGDFIGLDVGLDVISYVHDELGDSYYTPPRLLKELVRAGRLGKKTGGGVYEQPEEPGTGGSGLSPGVGTHRGGGPGGGGAGPPAHSDLPTPPPA